MLTLNRPEARNATATAAYRRASPSADGRGRGHQRNRATGSNVGEVDGLAARATR